jgi:formate dehydrogenase major subunit
MVQGIPEFRLPRDIVRHEIAQIAALGVDIQCSVSVDAEKCRALQAEYDAVVIAAGTHVPHLPDLPGIEAGGVHHGLEFLKSIHQGNRPDIGNQVLVIGGGFSAVDCARMSRRLGAESVNMVYRRSEQEMYIGEHELHQFHTEGVETRFQLTPVEILQREDSRVKGVRFQRTTLEPQADGRAVPVPIEGSDLEMPADTVLLGTGQKAAGWWQSLTGVFVAGDAQTGPGSLIEAIGHAKSVAREVDQHLMGTDRFETVVVATDALSTGRTRDMDAWPREPMPELSPDARDVTAEVEEGLSPDAAGTEASRCYLCHYKFEIDNELCIYCDRCLKVTPVEKCIVKVSDLIYDAQDRITGYLESTSTRDYNRLHLDQNQCIRCGACVEVCPVECITLQKVTEVTRPKKD